MSLLGNLTVGILGNMSGLSGTFTQAQNQVRQFGRQMQNIGSDLTTVGSTLTAAVTVPIVGLATASAKAAIDFESAFAGVRKTVDATEKEFAELRTGILKMSKEIPAAATEIAVVAEAAGQLGIKKEAIMGFTRTMVDLGVATNMSSDEAATSLARLANITQMNQKDFDRLGSSIVALGNNFATTEREIVDMAMRLAGAGAQVGMSEADILALATALSSVGIEAEMGGSAISRVMVNMQVATSTGFTKVKELLDSTGMSIRDLQMMASHSGKAFGHLAEDLGMTKTELTNLLNAGVDLENFSKIAGMTGEEFKKAFEQDAIGALGAFIEGLANAEEAGDSAINMLQEMGITEIRLRDSLLRAGGASELFADAVKLSTDAWEENVALSKEAEERYKTTASQLTIFWNQVKAIAIALGDALLPTLLAANEAIKPLLQWAEQAAVAFKKLDPSIQMIVIGVGALVAAIGPILATVGLMISGIGSAVTAFAGLSGAVAGAGGALGILTGPIGLIVAAIVGIGAALVAAWKHSETFRDTVTGIFNKVKDAAIQVFETVSGFTKEKLAGIKEFWDENGAQFLQAVEKVFNGIMAVVDFVMPAILFIVDMVWTAIKQIIDGALNVIMGLMKVFSGLFTGDFSLMWEGIKQIFWGAIDLIIGLMTVTFVGGLRTLLTNLAKGAINIVKNMGTGIVNGFKSFVTGSQNLAKGMVDWVVNLFRGFVDAVITLFNLFKTRGSSTFEAFSGVVKSIFTSLRNGLMTIWNGLTSFLTNGATMIKNGITSAFNALLNSIRTIWGSVKSTIEKLWSGVMTFFKNIDLRQVGKDIITGLINGIGSMASAVWNKAKEIANGIGDSIKDFFGIRSPSRLMMEYGGFIGEGLEIGIDGMVSKVKNAASEMARAAFPNVPQVDLSLNTQGTIGTNQSNDALLGNTFNFERMFDGAIFQVREDQDIQRIATALGSDVVRRMRTSGRR